MVAVLGLKQEGNYTWMIEWYKYKEAVKCFFEHFAALLQPLQHLVCVVWTCAKSSHAKSRIHQMN